MRSVIFTSIVLFVLSYAASAQQRDSFNESFPPSTILKPTLKVRCVRDLNYWKQPNLKNFWSWMPKLEFSVSGPIEDASYFTYEFFTPDGKAWFSLDSKPFSVDADSVATFESEAVPRWTDKRSTIATGTFTFRITLKNSLQNTSKMFYEGKFTVKKEFAGTPLADFKNQYLFYVDQDWTLPMAFINFNTKEDPNAPIFQTALWFRGDFNGKLKGYLFYNGKQVSNTEVGGAGETNYVLTEGDDAAKFRWEQWTFSFFNARYFDNDGAYGGRHVLKKNPGNYEVKVLLDDELVRVVSFTVGSDGKIVDSGVGRKNGLSGFGVLLPVKITTTKEGPVNLLSYKTDAFYGNVLNGF